MSVNDYLYRPLEGPRLVETIYRGLFMHRRDPDHEARAIGASRERRRLAEANRRMMT